MPLPRCISLKFTKLSDFVAQQQNLSHCVFRPICFLQCCKFTWAARHRPPHIHRCRNTNTFSVRHLSQTLSVCASRYGNANKMAPIEWTTGSAKRYRCFLFTSLCPLRSIRCIHSSFVDSGLITIAIGNVSCELSEMQPFIRLAARHINDIYQQ